MELFLLLFVFIILYFQIQEYNDLKRDHNVLLHDFDKFKDDTISNFNLIQRNFIDIDKKFEYTKNELKTVKSDLKKVKINEQKAGNSVLSRDFLRRKEYELFSKNDIKTKIDNGSDSNKDKPKPNKG